MQFLDSPDVDAIFLETSPSLDEAEAFCKLIASKQTKKPYGISFSGRENGMEIGGGAKIEDVVNTLKPYFEDPNFFSIGLNCTSIKAIGGFLDRINKSFETIEGRKPRIHVYPNSGEVYESP